MTDTEMILEELKNMQKRLDAMNQKIDSFSVGMDQKMDNVKLAMDQKMDSFRVDMDQKMDNFKLDISQKMEKFQSDMLVEFQKQTDTLSEKSMEIDRHLHETERNLKVYMENVVDRRITALREGLEIDQEYIDRNARTGRRLDERVESLETRVAVLESKTTA